MTERNKKGWRLSLIDPNTIDKEEKVLLIDKEEVKNLRQAHELVVEKLKDTDINITYEVFRKISNGSYKSKNSLIYRIIQMEKFEIITQFVEKRFTSTNIDEKKEKL